MAPPILPDVPQFYVFKPTGSQLIHHCLLPKALHGEVTAGCIVEGVDIFSARPRALPFHPKHRKAHGEVWGYFLAVQPAGEKCPAPGGCWVRYGPDKAYYGGGCRDGEAVAFRRRFAFRITWHGGAIWSPTRWLMKEYRVNKGAAAFRGAQPDPEADMDVVIRKVFKKPVAPPPPPPPPAYNPSEEEGADCSGVDEETDRLVKQLRALTEEK